MLPNACAFSRYAPPDSLLHDATIHQRPTSSKHHITTSLPTTPTRTASTSLRSKPPTTTAPVKSRKYTEAMIAFRAHQKAPVAFPGVKPTKSSHSRAPRWPAIRRPSTSSEDSFSTVADIAGRFVQSMESLIGAGATRESEESQSLRDFRVQDPFRASPYAASFIPNPESPFSLSEMKFSPPSTSHATTDVIKPPSAIPSETFGPSLEHSGDAYRISEHFDDGVSVELPQPSTQRAPKYVCCDECRTRRFLFIY